MAACVHDNPVTWCREYYRDGKLYLSICATALMSKAWPYKAEKWEPGRIVGDPAAMKPERVGVGRDK